MEYHDLSAGLGEATIRIEEFAEVDGVFSENIALDFYNADFEYWPITCGVFSTE